MNVRLAKNSDSSEWLRLLQLLYPEEDLKEHLPLVEAYFGEHAGDDLKLSAVFVFERPEGGLGGLLELSVRDYAEGCSGRTPYIESWYVDPDLRGQGVGRALVEAAEAWARARGYTELASDTWLDNTPSQAAHAALGFQETERIVTFRKAL